MKKGKRVMLILGCIAAVLVLFIVSCTLNHRIRLGKEDIQSRPIGQRVDVNGAMMNVYTEGSGDKTLVFMSGGGTCCPVLDFRSLYSLLSDDYRIAVVEKFGYGFSDITDTERDIDTILECTRTALEKAGVTGPFVLCPHSMSGIEAIYWSQKYPDEVSAIIGLDMAVPAAYNSYPINMFTIRLGRFAAVTGITRLLPGAAESDAIKYGTLTKEEKDIYRAVFYSRTATPNMIAEVQKIKENAALTGQGTMPDIPVLLFVSNGSGTGMQEAEWHSFPLEFIAEIPNGRAIMLDCPHYVHDHEFVRISEEIKSFLG